MRLRVLLTLVSALSITVAARTASAQATRTWVSGVGDDANPCSRTAPCKTFAGAISKTATGGEIDALDPGGFGAVTITKSITIDGHGTFASILSTGVNGIVITNAAVVVNLRNLSINGAGTGLSGIVASGGTTVHVEDCNILNVLNNGIDFEPTTPATLFVKHTNISTVGNGTTGTGILVGQMGQAVISKSFISNAVDGLHLTQSARATVHDSVFAGHTGHGLWAETTSVINMDHGLIANNGVGAQGDSTVRLSEVMVGHNTTGLAGANVASFGNNRVKAGNGTDGAPTSTIPQQ